MCDVLTIPRSTYYDQNNRKLSKRSLENKRLKQIIMDIYLKSKKRYGAQRLLKLLFDSFLKIERQS